MEDANKGSWIQKIGIREENNTKTQDKTAKIVTKPTTIEKNTKNEEVTDGMMHKMSRYRESVTKQLMQAQEQVDHCEKTRESMAQYEIRARQNLNTAFSVIDKMFECFEDHITDLTNNYQADIESIMDCYKNEKETFQNIQHQHDGEMEDTISRMRQMQELYNQEIQNRTDNTEALREAVDHIKKLEGIIRQEQSLRKSAEGRTKDALREIEQRDLDFKREIQDRETINEQNRQAMEKTRSLLMKLFDNSFDKTAALKKEVEHANITSPVQASSTEQSDDTRTDMFSY